MQAHTTPLTPSAPEAALGERLRWKPPQGELLLSDWSQTADSLLSSVSPRGHPGPILRTGLSRDVQLCSFHWLCMCVCVCVCVCSFLSCVLWLIQPLENKDIPASWVVLEMAEKNPFMKLLFDCFNLLTEKLNEDSFHLNICPILTVFTLQVHVRTVLF